VNLADNPYAVQQNYSRGVITMSARNFALISGVFFITIGVLGFIPGLVTPMANQTDPPLLIETGYGYLFGLFPTNIVHNLVHVAVGVWGFTSARSDKGALFYCQAFTILYSLIVVMGLLPGLGTTLGLMPVFGGNVLLNLGATALAAYCGFVAISNVEPVPDR
jgi:hypothetical protein